MDCGIIQVSTGSDTRSPYDIFHGLYSLSEDKSEPNNPVWKSKDKPFYIFNSGGFRIGDVSDLTTGDYYYKSERNCCRRTKNWSLHKLNGLRFYFFLPLIW